VLAETTFNVFFVATLQTNYIYAARLRFSFIQTFVYFISNNKMILVLVKLKVSKTFKLEFKFAAINVDLTLSAIKQQPTNK
jgi:hypothetical protein